MVHQQIARPLEITVENYQSTIQKIILQYCTPSQNNIVNWCIIYKADSYSHLCNVITRYWHLVSIPNISYLTPRISLY